MMIESLRKNLTDCFNSNINYDFLFELDELDDESARMLRKAVDDAFEPYLDQEGAKMCRELVKVSVWSGMNLPFMSKRVPYHIERVIENAEEITKTWLLKTS